MLENISSQAIEEALADIQLGVEKVDLHILMLCTGGWQEAADAMANLALYGKCWIPAALPDFVASHARQLKCAVVLLDVIAEVAIVLRLRVVELS